MLTASVASSETGIDLRYGRLPGADFRTVRQFRAEGVLQDGTTTVPVRLEGKVSHVYSCPASADDGERPDDESFPMEFRLESADCRIDLGARSISILLTEERMEIDGVTLWEKSDGKTGGGLLEGLFHPRRFRLSPKGEIEAGEGAWSRRYSQGEDPGQGDALALAGVVRLDAVHTVFPKLPEGKTGPGDGWSFAEEDEPPQDGPSVWRHRTNYFFRGKVEEGSRDIWIGFSTTAEAEEAEALSYHRILPLPSSEEGRPTLIRERIGSLEVRDGKRRYEGTFRFDPVNGRVMESRFSGDLEIDLTSVIPFSDWKPTRLRAPLSLKVETHTEYVHPTP